MPFFPETIAEAARQPTVRVALLLSFAFASGTQRYWTGFGPLDAGGNLWQGSGDLIQVDGLSAPTGTVAAPTTVSISGVDPDFVTAARNASDEVKGRALKVFLQFFTEDWQPLDNPVLIWSGVMDQMQYSAEGQHTRAISLSAEGIWAGRNRPPFGLLTSADQKARYPGDRGLDRTADLVQKTIRWPTT